MPTPDELGGCGRVLDERNEIVCNKPAVAEVLVRTKFGLMVARLCQEDYSEHRAFYARLNRHRPKRSRQHHQSKSTPANDSPRSTPGSQNESGRPSLHHAGRG